MEEITRFDMDMDGSMESSDHGQWVRYEDVSQRTWVGLTDEEKHAIRYSHMTSAEFIEFIEAKLKDKNTRGQE